MTRENSDNNDHQELKIITAGIGGQGVVFATRLLAQTAISIGLSVMASETHGMSQRGGSVVSHLKIGGTKAPLIRRGTADILFALAASEGLRNLSYARREGCVFVNSADGLPGDVSSHLNRLQINLHCYPAQEIAMGLGTPTVTNVALIGYAAAFRDFTIPRDAIERTLTEIASRQLDVNLKALDAGYKAGREAARLSTAEDGTDS